MLNDNFKKRINECLMDRTPSLVYADLVESTLPLFYTVTAA